MGYRRENERGKAHQRVSSSARLTLTHRGHTRLRVHRQQQKRKCESEKDKTKEYLGGAKGEEREVAVWWQW